jgi:hypothetical protein
MERRKDIRIKKRLLATVNNLPGIVIDISEWGLKFSMSKVPAVFNVKIVLDADNHKFMLDGLIRWVSRRFPLENLNEIGVMLDNPSAEYQAFVRSLTLENNPNSD